MVRCPVCKAEFEEEIYVCPECGNHTVFEKYGEEFTLAFNATLAKDEAAVDEILDFFHYSDMPEAYAQFDEVMEAYQIFVHPDHRREASKLYSGFRKAKKEEEDEAKKEAAAEASEADAENAEILEDDEEEEHVGVFQDKKEKYTDFHSSGITLIIAAVAVGIFTVLNALGTISIFSGWLPITVFALLSLGFLYAGISSLKRSGELQYEIREEKQSREIAREWLSENVTLEMLKDLVKEGDPSEVTAMKQLEFIGNKLQEQFESSEEFLDELAEEYYDELMQKNQA